MKLSSLGTQCLIALFLGMVFGLLASVAMVNFVVPLGEAFIKLLQMLIIPLTLSTIISSLCKQDNLGDLGPLSFYTLFWFLVTALLATWVALAIGTWVEPGAGQLMPPQDISTWNPREIPSFSVLFLNLIPGNLSTTFAGTNVLPVIVFSLLFGAAINLATVPGSAMRVFFEEFSNVMFLLTRWIIRCSPVAVFALIAPVIAEYGLEGMKPLASFIIAVYVACMGQLLVYAILILVVARMSPWRFYRAIWPMMVMAFSTSSSLATLPVTINTLTYRLNLPEKLVSFVASLGATMKMDGCGAIFPVIVAIFTANMFGYTLNIEQYIVLCATAVVATIGTAGVPGTASIMATVALASIGFPLEGLAMVIGIDKIVDVMRTTVNVTGTGACSVLIASCVKKELPLEQDKK